VTLKTTTVTLTIHGNMWKISEEVIAYNFLEYFLSNANSVTCRNF
jgi:hypothetical protein